MLFFTAADIPDRRSITKEFALWQYIKIKSFDEKEINNDKKMSKNENNTTIDTDFIQQSTISKGYEISE